MSLLVISEILGLFGNTLIGDDKYSLRNSENLRHPIQMELSKIKISSKIFAPFLKSTSNLQHFEKKVTLIGYVFLRS